MKIVETITGVIDWLEGLFHKEYGIRVFYMMLFLIPSVSLYFLYKSEVTNSERLLKELQTEQDRYRICLETKSDLKRGLREEVRKEVMTEFRDVFDAINEFQLDVILENNKTVEKIRNIENKIKE